MSTPSPSDQLVVDLDHPLPATWSLVGLVGLVHLASGSSAWGRLSAMEAWILARPTWLRVAAGGQTAELVDAGQWWRLATSVWVHGGLLHLVLNAVAVVALGRILEPWLGGARMMGVFAAGGTLASVGSHVLGVPQSDGASGAAFAMLGVVGVLGLRLRRRLDPADALVLGPVVWAVTALNLVAGFVIPQIDGVSHLAGWGVGLGLGVVCDPGRRGRGLVAGAFLGVCLWGWTIGLP